MGTQSGDIDADSRRIPSMNPINDGRSGRSRTVYGLDEVVEACTGLAPPWLSPLVPLARRPAHLPPAWAGCDPSKLSNESASSPDALAMGRALGLRIVRMRPPGALLLKCAHTGDMLNSGP